MSNRKKLDLAKLRTKLIFRMIDDLNQPLPVRTVEEPVDDGVTCDCWCHQDERTAQAADQDRNSYAHTCDTVGT